MGCRRLRTRDVKDLAEKKIEDYDEIMIQDLINMLNDELDGLSVEEVDQELMEEIFYNWKQDLPDPGEWAFDEVLSDYESYCESKADEARDERL